MDDRQLSRLATELGALAAETPGVVRVQARPGFGTAMRRAVDGLTAVVGGGDGGDGDSAGDGGVGGIGSDSPATGPSAPIVGIVASRAETRVTLDIAVSDEASGPRVARDVAESLLGRLALEPDLLEPSLDLRIVGVGPH
ncbi:hypothetical protein [Frigoribacterium sp. Leaf172]|uniref:hypothetical protein n=1 Tax=Frigoribacterium sp. Leaf172 TaxID=1736285 RepID=UPI000701575C|nr:hypothetical protein [Frigoribacterium sp. Leaf172]KQR65660.1 hypothetical protein ASF89_00165 [Frigoribacterium sp. Leaf172]